MNIQAGPKVLINGDDPLEIQAMPDDDNLVTAWSRDYYTNSPFTVGSGSSHDGL
nr:MAG TPA: hypothetical protein [Crassvirales sp.]